MAILNLLLPILVVILAFVGIIYLAVSRTLEMKELATNGIDVTAIVTEKKSLPNTRSSTRRNKIAYTYNDKQGQTHAGVTQLGFDEYDTYQVGGPIEITYSAKRPHVSGPRYYVDMAREALRRNA